MALLALVGLSSCERDDRTPSSLAASGTRSVLLITLDTTRADRIGAYGYAHAETPAFDELARSGVRFDRAQSPVPMTLPSHGTLLTGTYPATNGSRINGVAVQQEGIPFLAAEFKRRGYRTGAFVASVVLDSVFGLDRGFDVYDDYFGGQDFVERPADEVCDDALTWLRESPQQPFFAWIHFYDPHDPYEPPAEYRARFSDPYDGEIAFADAQIGRLVRWLEDENRREQTLVVVTADHGESFGEHDEPNHGLFVYRTTMHIPLVFVFPPEVPAGVSVSNVVGLVDVFPTIVDLLGWDVPTGLEGTSLVGAWSGATLQSQEVYGESEYPSAAFGWAGLRCLTTPDWRYIQAPYPELYNTLRDPDELVNVIDAHREIAAQLRKRLRAAEENMIPRWTGSSQISPAMLSRLESLGYVAGGARTERNDKRAELRDPKDMVGHYKTFVRATGHHASKRFNDVIMALEPLVGQFPEAEQFLVTLGQAYLAVGRAAEAQRSFESSLRIVPNNPRQLWRLGEALRKQSKIEDAIAAYRAALAITPDFAVAHCSLGDLLSQLGQDAEAIEHFAAAVKADPELARAGGRLGVAYARQQQFAMALPHLQRYVELEPESPHALSNLGNVLIALGQPDAAADVLGTALTYDSRYGPAHRALPQALLAARRPAEALGALRVALATFPSDTVMKRQLVRLLVTIPRDDLRNPVEAVRLAEELCSRAERTSDDLMSLAVAQAANSERDGAARAANTARSLAQASGDTAKVRQIETLARRFDIDLDAGQ